MSTEIYTRISYYSQQGRSILNSLQQAHMRPKTVGSEIVKDLVSVGNDSISNGLGEFIGELLDSRRAEKYGRKYTKLYLNQQNIQAIASLTSQFEVGFQYWFTEIKSFLSQVSVQKTNLVQPGNSEILLRKLNQIFRYTKTETKIRRTLAVLEEVSSLPLVYSRSLPTKEEMKEKEKKMPYDNLQRLENTLREFISKELSKIIPDWWIQRVPPDVRKLAEERKAKNENLWPWHQEKGLPLMYYVDFPDYIRIIIRKDNWKDFFAPVFKDKEAISTKLRELEPIRNDIAHSREISPQAGKKLEIYSGEIIVATQK